jgi:hypothetical protein
MGVGICVGTSDGSLHVGCAVGGTEGIVVGMGVGLVVARHVVLSSPSVT